MRFDRYDGFDKRGGWNKRGGWKIFMKSINVEGGFFLWRVEFFKIGKCDFTFIREMRVLKILGFTY